MRLGKRIQFLLSATNHHGVHSPFIFRLVTQGLYATDAIQGTKSDRAFLKCLAYFRPEHIEISETPRALKNRISQQFPDCRHNQNTYDICYLRQVQPEHPIFSSRRAGHNDQIAFIHAPYQTATSEARWKRIKALNCVTVTVDFYYGALVFFRREQEKEHFKIRF